MSDVNFFIESGILEMYVFGETNEEETLEVQRMSARYEVVRKEIEEISIALESYAALHAIEPDPMIRPFLLATIEYSERIKKGEMPASPPILHEGSRIEDYQQWLNRDDLQLKEPLTDVFAAIIGYTPQVTTAIVWIRDGAPPETHIKEYEKFLIVEGTCDIIIDKAVHEMYPGKILSIPLHLSHEVKVTSPYPCKIILQRIAA